MLEFLIGNATQSFTNLLVMVERIEQAIEVGTMNFDVMMDFKLGNGFQIRILVRQDLTISSATQTPLTNIDISLSVSVICQNLYNTGILLQLHQIL